MRLKSDFWTFDEFRTKLLWTLEMLQKLILLKVLFTKVIKTHSYFFPLKLLNRILEKYPEEKVHF